MVKKTITYEDYNGEEVSEDFFFHMSQAELIELEVSFKGGLSEQLKRIIEAEDPKELIAEFKHILLLSYGKKSDDGRRFVKNQAIRDDLQASPAYDKLFMELVTDAGKAAEFINGVIPKGMAEQAAKVAQAPPIAAVPDQKDKPDKPELETISKETFDSMTAEEKVQVFERMASGEVAIRLDEGQLEIKPPE